MESAFLIIWSVMIIILAFIDMNSIGDRILKFIAIFLLLTYIIIIAILIGYDKGQKDALRGKFDYKMEIKYELKDSIYTPVDTTFVEINK